MWRTVVCRYCAAEVSPCEDTVRASRFRDAYLRSTESLHDPAQSLECAGQRYRILLPLANGTSARVVLAERAGAFPELTVLKIAHATTVTGRLGQEREILAALQSDTSAGSAYFSQRLPQVAGFGTTTVDGGEPREVLVLRNPTGFWGSLAQVRHNYPAGIDPRHAVWMWRRVLEVLAYIHELGWAHGNLAPEHLLVHPADHGVLIIGWARARQYQTMPAGASSPVARDLVQAAWTIRAMLAGSTSDAEPQFPSSTPSPLVALLKHASEDPGWAASLGARGLEQQLGTAAREAFGPPSFIDFSPTRQH
jgi:serine/threonine protein kinase